MKPFLDDQRNWQDIVAGNHLLLDSDFIITVLAYKAEEIFRSFKDLGCVCVHIHPVILEVQNSNSLAARAQRLSLLNEYSTRLPFGRAELDSADKLQGALIKMSIYPSPADLYLGGTLHKYSNAQMTLLTSNLSDFPEPFFTREGYITMQGANNSKNVALLRSGRL